MERVIIKRNRSRVTVTAVGAETSLRLYETGEFTLRKEFEVPVGSEFAIRFPRFGKGTSVTKVIDEKSGRFTHRTEI